MVVFWLGGNCPPCPPASYGHGPVHCCENRLESSLWIPCIRAKVEPERGARRYDSAGCIQVTTEFHQQGTWGRRAVVNPQIVVAPLCVEVRKHHLNRVAIWHCEAPVTVVVVSVILRVLWARKSTRLLPTDGRWATCGQSICASVRGGTNRPNYTELSNDVIWRPRTRYLPGPALDIFQPSVLTCKVTGEAFMATCLCISGWEC